MSYFDEWFYITKSRLRKLDRYYAKSPNVYYRFQRLLLKYHFVSSNMRLMLSCFYFKQLVVNMFSRIPEIRKNLLSSKLVPKIKINFSKNLNKFSTTYIQETQNKSSCANYQIAWESIFIQKMSRMFKVLYKLSVTSQKDLIKQCNQIIHIYLYLNKRVYLILNNPKYYTLIDTSIERVDSLQEQSSILPSNYKKNMKSVLRRYIKSIQSWKWFRYQYIWFSKQIPILNEHQKIIIEFLFPKIAL